MVIHSTVFEQMLANIKAEHYTREELRKEAVELGIPVGVQHTAQEIAMFIVFQLKNEARSNVHKVGLCSCRKTG
jgi:hypothetical protein